MESEHKFCSIAEDFTREFFRIYLEERDFEGIKAYMHSEITWVGTGEHEICRGYADAMRLLEAEHNAWDGRFEILDDWLTTLPISEDSFAVYGEMNIREAGDLTTILLDMKSRLSLICKKENGVPKVYHVHFSVPNAAQADGAYVHKRLTADYSQMLEDKLQERTRQLKEKMYEFEGITNNLMGGIEICRYSPDFLILYASDGFYQLCGYTQQEIESKFGGSHLALVYEPDRLALSRKISESLKENGNFSVEYRICHKDGRLLWVLDKGTYLPPKDGQQRVQCVLTDITDRKAQEEALRLSERRYITALRLTEATVFEYDILKKQLLFFDDVADMYGVPNVVENGVETFIGTGIIEPATAADYYEMYRKIIAGEPSAKCFISSRDKYGKIHDFQLSLVTIFDDEGKPVRAVGVRRSASQLLQLQKEQAYSETLVSGKRFLCEADLSIDQMLQVSDWLCDELGIKPGISYKNTIEKIVFASVVPEKWSEVCLRLSAEYIENKFNSGSSLYTFSYLRNRGGEPRWYECTVNVIRDQRSGHFNMRLYHQDVHERTLKKQRAAEEQKLYETMVAKSNIAYEFNITRNLALNGHEHWDEDFGVQHSSNYGNMILAFAKCGIHSKDADSFTSAYQRERLLECFAAGQTRIPCEYRRKERDGQYRWALCTVHLYSDPTTGDIKGFAYVEDIDEQKRIEIKLQYNAQHDHMTGLYNRVTAEAAINKFLDSPEADMGCQAFFMVDIDYFKHINDTFGHPFGDRVLSETAARIRSVFAKGDVVGRIGGDEFCVLMKNVNRQEAVCAKAQELCDRLRHTYTRDGYAVTVSASVGIAMCEPGEISYQSLFERADKALYTAKANGRDRYFV